MNFDTKSLLSLHEKDHFEKKPRKGKILKAAVSALCAFTFSASYDIVRKKDGEQAMKQVWIAMILSLILCLAGCGGQSEQENPQELTTTVMIYMVGSDLEAKTGAGTEDLTEIAGSGVDLSKTNVLVYAGGSPKWHNDLADPEKHTVLLLKEEGFQQITQLQAYSMGESQCLSNFLKYGYSNYPAQQYMLILWNHGNGPVMGYGKDMLFGNDSLTLSEMRQALEDSPFGEGNKLAWVGFDACLMASAELCCV